MFLGDYDLGDPLVFYVQAVDMAGSVDNATGPVPYRIYRDEVVGVIETGFMTQLAGQVGLYSAATTLTPPIFGPYLAGSYVIRVQAPVDGENPGVVMFFRIRSSSFAEQVWKRLQPVAPDSAAMEDIKTDTDQLEFTGEEG